MPTELSVFAWKQNLMFGIKGRGAGRGACRLKCVSLLLAGHRLMAPPGEFDHAAAERECWQLCCGLGVDEPTGRAGVPGSVGRCGSHVSGRIVLGRVKARPLSKAYPAGLLPHTAIL